MTTGRINQVSRRVLSSLAYLKAWTDNEKWLHNIENRRGRSQRELKNTKHFTRFSFPHSSGDFRRDVVKRDNKFVDLRLPTHSPNKESIQSNSNKYVFRSQRFSPGYITKTATWSFKNTFQEERVPYTWKTFQIHEKHKQDKLETQTSCDQQRQRCPVFAWLHT